MLERSILVSAFKDIRIDCIVILLGQWPYTKMINAWQRQVVVDTILTS